MPWTLVTGGAKGLGADICLHLAQQGFDLVIHYHQSQKEAEQLAENCRMLGVQAAALAGDFSQIETTIDFIQRYQEHFADTAYLINNVGNYIIKSSLNTSMDEWLKLFQTNLHAPFILIKHLVSSLCQHRGHIINIGAAGLGRMRADTYSTAYTLTKQNLWMLTRSLALELAPAGVRVNMVSPGHLETSVNLPTDPLKLPMGRPGYHHEISRLILFLLDPANHYITGQNIEVAGGVSLQ